MVIFARTLACAALLIAPGSALRPTVVVTAATGRVGAEVVRSLRDHDAEVVLLVRDRAKSAALFGDDAGGAPATILEADYADVDALRAAFGAVQAPFRLFLASANGPAQATLETNVLSAACDAGATFCVKLSTVGAVLQMKRGGPYAAHLEVEQALRDSGLDHAVLRPNLFMQMLLGGGMLAVSDAIRAGKAGADACVHPFAERPVSMIDCRDVAAVAAALCACDDDTLRTAHAGQTYDLTGPESLALRPYLALALGEDAVVLPCSAAEYVNAMGGQLPASLADSLVGFFETLGGDCAAVTEAVPGLLGRPARTLRVLLGEHAEAFGVIRSE